MSKQRMKNKNEQLFIENCLKRLERNRQESADRSERPQEWYDFHARTDEVLVPSKWVTRLKDANAVNDQLQYLRDKIDDDFSSLQKTEKVDREELYCSSALYKIRQNKFYQRLHDHQIRWQPITLVGELAASLPKPTTDPAEIERKLFSTILILTMLRRPLTKIDIKVDEIEDLNAAIQERKNQKPNTTNRESISAPILPPPTQSVFSFLDGVGTGATPR
ncbi:unnamed protein product [Adineta ricciae]|uniref:Uncharacterized protein n=1 Tax=Adineta ricciae TaxID=249248 RepID=A0A815FBB7_ADIRI|nr:unnamed protein product [Adineta ricciae]CAF1321283.1 unnamed protein product [Adineta ricciae]